ncbi:hydrolase 2, exosortase A system-associated [Roseateles koreensis]|uniref:Hydrolase 2, exosortase A system-associated n=1 Tax=Roseateles koreensis TaxID=2987526 RepID=A0ABT5KTB3_9BURK|nr:hydrolase 2, exosortase A system-associated [Roseateles koreensis]MDC8786154.1 hydrolase 2, exosortase A system-associated [Roseateles koreensis]
MPCFQAFFLEGPQGKGQRFCIFHPAQGVTRGRVLHIHPFAEEMNKSRQMSALQARKLAQAGFAVLQIDLFGCGDSSGDFGDASWQDWLDDVALGAAWLSQQGSEPLWLWGHRLGCLLACEAAPSLNEACHFLFWQAPSTGRVLLQQFLRLKVASGMLEGGPNTISTDALKAELLAGGSVEIAGYRLSSALAAGMEKATLSPPALASAQAWAPVACWFEVSSQALPEPSPAISAAIQRWEAAGIAVRYQSIPGPQFWQTAEIELAPALLESSCSALRDAAPSSPASVARLDLEHQP